MQSNEAEKWQRVFLDNLSHINRIIRQVCHSTSLDQSEADDFRSEVYLHLIGNDYAVLREFANRSTLRTYLAAVIKRRFLDLMRRKGRWRPSKISRELGETGILIDRLLNQQGWSEDETYQILTVNHQLAISRQEFQKATRALPRRSPRPRFEALGDHSWPHASPITLPRPTAKRERRSINAALQRAVSALSWEEKRILRLKFEGKMPLTSIARKLDCNYKTLHGQLNRALLRLRVELEREGFDRTLALEALNRADEPLSVKF